ncbi:hypothetical protein JCM14076_20050 [Methylosoma difficile]
MAEINLSTIAAGIGGFIVNGQTTSSSGDQSGFSVASAGDVNGDGLDDLIIGAKYATPAASLNIGGRAFVVFGKTGTTAVDLSAVVNGTGGFVINAQGTQDFVGQSVSSAGDVNGDGLDDLIVGAPFGPDRVGRGFVVFGKTSTSAIDLSAVAAGTGGFIIRGESAYDASGYSISDAGDVNGDGLGDLIVGARGSDTAAGTNAGRSYVVFGKSTGTAVDMSAIVNGVGGFAINGQTVRDYSGLSVSSAGDVNGDGLADLLVGAPFNDTAGGYNAGSSYVVFGKTGTTAVDLSAVAAGTGGFVISGECSRALTGRSVSSAGDINGDGLADLIIGAPRTNGFLLGAYFLGRSYVVFGKTGTAAVDLSAISAGTGGFAIRGESLRDFSGLSVSAAGDINGDGLSDVIVGAYYADPAGVSSAGRSYVVFGKTGTATVELSAIAAGTGGFAINGQSADDFSGYSVAAAGDVNGDGLADLIVGARRVDTADGIDAGRSYIIFGKTSGAFAATAVDKLGGSGNNTMTSTSAGETMVAGAGNDTLIGNGGADVLYGGSGDDNFVLNADNLAKLSLGVTSGQLARVDGGSGIDKITLDGSGLNFDLTTIANQGGNTPGSSSRIESIERIDLASGNQLALSVKDVQDMAGFNIFNNSNGWADGTYNLAAGGAGGVNPEQRHQLVVDGNATDVLNFTDSANWQFVGTVSNSGITYNVFNHFAAAQVLVASTVNLGNFAPSDLAISTDNINENVAPNSLVGTFSSTDANASDTFTYSFAAGGANNNAFTIIGNALHIKNSPDFESKASYSIKVRTTDQGGLFFDKVLTININNQNDAPVLVAPANISYTDTAFDDTFAKVTGKLSASDADGNTLTYGIVGGTDNGSGIISLVGTFGTLAVNASTGAYSFTANDAAIEALSSLAVQGAIFTVSDGLVTVNQNISITLSQSGITETLGNDSLNGTAGANKINGLAGADTMTGGLGNDTYSVDDIGDKVIETSTLATEIDTVNSEISYSLGNNVENLTLTGTGNINGTGNALNNVVTGNSGNNLLVGGLGVDTLKGGAGDDIINGGLGNDILSGNAGLDIFRFNTTLTANIDKINDFVVADDTIQLENAIFTQLTSTGTLAAGNFVMGALALDGNDFVRYNSNNGGLFYDADGNGAGVAVQIATLGVGLALTNADFVVI